MRAVSFPHPHHTLRGENLLFHLNFPIFDFLHETASIWRKLELADQGHGVQLRSCCEDSEWRHECANCRARAYVRAQRALWRRRESKSRAGDCTRLHLSARAGLLPVRVRCDSGRASVCGIGRVVPLR